MGKESSVSALFGLTQPEMAQLLGVGLSLYSMFECGQRSLPLAAQERLNILLVRMQPAKAGKIKAVEPDAEMFRLHLERLLHENRYQYENTVRKIEVLERKSNRAARLSELRQHLEALELERKDSDSLSFRLPKKKSEFASSPDIGNALMKLKCRLELLEAERIFLVSKLGNGRHSPK